MQFHGLSLTVQAIGNSSSALAKLSFFSSKLQVIFRPVHRSAIALADILAKQGVDRSTPWVLVILKPNG